MNMINRINREELKTRLDRGDNITLVMTMNEWAYNTAHIPGSLDYNAMQRALVNLKRDDEIVIYDTGNACPASMRTYRLLQQNGFRNIRQYAGGLMDWDAAGYPLEGSMMVH
jgi:3-mercaptopyruvate sulfurtransferase SseA